MKKLAAFIYKTYKLALRGLTVAIAALMITSAFVIIKEEGIIRLINVFLLAFVTATFFLGISHLVDWAKVVLGKRK